jgi:hypothetical protein
LLHFQETVDYAMAQAEKDIRDFSAEEQENLVPSGEDEG